MGRALVVLVLEAYIYVRMSVYLSVCLSTCLSVVTDVEQASKPSAAFEREKETECIRIRENNDASR